MTIGKLAEVAPLLDLVRRNDGFDVLRFVEHFGRKMMRQMEFADHDLDVDAEIVFVAQNFDHASARILRGRGPVGDLDIHDYAFEIVPFGAASGFVAKNAIHGFIFLCNVSPSCLGGTASQPPDETLG